MKFKKYYTDTDQLTSFPALIQAAGEPLVDYTITGNTGGVAARTANLYNWQDGYVDIYPTEQGTIDKSSNRSTFSIIIPVVSGTTYTFSMNVYSNYYRRRIGFTDIYPAQGGTCLEVDTTTDDTPTRLANTFTAPTGAEYALIMFCSGTKDETEVLARTKTITVQEGQSVDYTPYYVVPVTSGGVTTNLPVTAPLGLTDTLTYTDTGIAIPTLDGDNTISFGTTVQPSAMSAEFKGWHSQDTVRVYNGSQWE